MTVSQQELGRRFARGDSPDQIPDSSNVSVESFDGDRIEALVIGYGWAVYAARTRDGTIWHFNGWRGYSTSTSGQLTQLRNGYDGVAEVKSVGDARPERHDVAEHVAVYGNAD